MSFIQKSISRALRANRPGPRHVGGTCFGGGASAPHDRPASATGSRGRRGVTTSDALTTTPRAAGEEKAAANAA